MNAGELLNSIALQSGISADAPELKSLLSSADLVKISVPDDFSNLLSEQYKKLVTIDSAKHNPDLKKHFVAEALNGVDAQIMRVAKDVLGLDDDTIAGIKKLDSTSKKISELVTKVKPSGNDDERFTKLKDSVNDLNIQLLAKEKEKEDIKISYVEKLRDRSIQDMFNKFDYTENLPKDVQMEVARSIFSSDLKKTNRKIAFDENGNNIRLLTDADTEVHINNKPVNINQYLQSLLAENKLLKVASPAKNGDNKKEPIIFNNGAADAKINNQSYLQELEAAAQDLNN